MDNESLPNIQDFKIVFEGLPDGIEIPKNESVSPTIKDMELVVYDKPYPYKSKKRRHIKKWQKKHIVKKVVYHNVTISDILTNIAESDVVSYDINFKYSAKE